MNSDYTEDSVIRWSLVIPGQTLHQELRWLYRRARSQPAHAAWVEVGTWCGRSFFTTGMGLPPTATLTAVDIWDGTLRIPETLELRKVAPSADWVQGQFRLTCQELHRFCPELTLSLQHCASPAAAAHIADYSIDVVFLDADHTEQALREDISAWLPKLKPGGTICGHDYREDFPGVIAAVDELLPGRQRGPGSLWYAVP